MTWKYKIPEQQMLLVGASHCIDVWYCEMQVVLELRHVLPFGCHTGISGCMTLLLKAWEICAKVCWVHCTRKMLLQKRKSQCRWRKSSTMAEYTMLIVCSDVDVWLQDLGQYLTMCLKYGYIFKKCPLGLRLISRCLIELLSDTQTDLLLTSFLMKMSINIFRFRVEVIHAFCTLKTMFWLNEVWRSLFFCKYLTSFQCDVYRSWSTRRQTVTAVIV